MISKSIKALFNKAGKIVWEKIWKRRQFIKQSHFKKKKTSILFYMVFIIDHFSTFKKYADIPRHGQCILNTCSMVDRKTHFFYFKINLNFTNRLVHEFSREWLRSLSPKMSLSCWGNILKCDSNHNELAHCLLIRYVSEQIERNPKMISLAFRTQGQWACEWLQIFFGILPRV